MEYFKQLVNVVKKIHDIGYLHRDIKPNNILVSEGKLYLVDFGLAAPVNDSFEYVENDGVTLTGWDGFRNALIRLPEFDVSNFPDRVRRKESDTALCVAILWYMISGKPRRGIKVINNSYPGGLRFDPKICYIICKGLQEDIESRFHDCAEILDILERDHEPCEWLDMIENLMKGQDSIVRAVLHALRTKIYHLMPTNKRIKITTKSLPYLRKDGTFAVKSEQKDYVWQLSVSKGVVVICCKKEGIILTGVIEDFIDDEENISIPQNLIDELDSRIRGLSY